MIHAISSASTWTRVRRHMTRPDSCPDAICRRCSTDEIETDFHRIWSCPANREIDGIEKSQHLFDEACRHWESCPVFWLRGWIPSTWTQPPDVVEPALAEEHGPWAHNPSPLHGFSPHLWGRRWLRGEAIKRPTVSRRCGYGLVVVNTWGSLKPVSHVLWWTQWPPDCPSCGAPSLFVFSPAYGGPCHLH